MKLSLFTVYIYIYKIYEYLLLLRIIVSEQNYRIYSGTRTQDL